MWQSPLFAIFEGGVEGETDLSAEQSLAQDDPWFPRAHEDEGWPSRHQKKASAWQEEAYGVIRTGH